ncbi:hypothetical protein [Rummeliibacillus pycnus]|uniref:hypothetical protein n=1 Tax=Rummeliibacillus pycnus TaxID=101070 RepID=UPI000C9B1D7B|nr:hypothetical protein [Rummeliibacillus pycnus]
MSKPKKLLSFSLTCALSLGIMSNMFSPTIVSAAEQNQTASEHQSTLNPKTQQKVDEILNKLDADLAKIGAPVPKHHANCEAFNKLDDQTKAKVKEIMKKVKDGSLTKEEAEKQLKALGISFPKHPKAEMFSKLDDKTKTKVKEIMKKVKDGSLTKEDAEKQLKALGISFPKHPRAEMFSKLDDKTKAKVKEIMKNVKDGSLTKEEAEKQLKALGVSFPKHYGKFKHLDADTKAKAQTLIKEAKSQVNKLGADFPSNKYGYLNR